MNNIRQKVVIIGAGGFGREVLDIFEAYNREHNIWEIIGFVDDNPSLHDKKIRGYPVVGSVDWFRRKEAKDVKSVIAVGDNTVRQKIAKKARENGAKFCNIIHPSVIKTEYIDFGEGIIVTAGCILTNNIKVGNHVIINLDVTVGHDTIIDDFVNLNPGVHINGDNKILEGAFVGSGAVTIQGITIGKWSIIGAGACVIRDIPDNVVAVGVPAKPIKSSRE